MQHDIIGTLPLREKMIAAGIPLGTVAGGKIYRGIVSGLNKAFLIDGAKRAALIVESPKAVDIIKPYLGGKHVRKWVCEYPDQWMIYMPHGVSKEGLDAVLDHLRPFKKQLEARATEHEWYELQQPQEKFIAAYSQTKIIFPDIANDLRFALDTKGTFISNTAYCVATDDLYLLAVLNAKATQYFYVNISPRISGGYFRFWTKYVEQIPVPTATTDQRPVIVNLVDHLLFLHRQPSVTKSDPAHPRDPLIADYFEQWLNALVYELFFPEELHAQKLNFFMVSSKAVLPPLESLPNNERLPHLRDFFEKLYDLNHALRASLFSLGSLELVRIIEGGK